MTNANKELIKATKNSNIVFTGSGSAELPCTKRITDGGKPSGIIVCKNLTVVGMGSAMRLQCPCTMEAQAFYKVRATD